MKNEKHKMRTQNRFGKRNYCRSKKSIKRRIWKRVRANSPWPISYGYSLNKKISMARG